MRNYSTVDNRTLATLLGRSVGSVQHKAIRLGLRKSERFWDDYYVNYPSLTEGACRWSHASNHRPPH